MTLLYIALLSLSLISIAAYFKWRKAKRASVIAKANRAALRKRFHDLLVDEMNGWYGDDSPQDSLFNVSKGSQ